MAADELRGRIPTGYSLYTPRELAASLDSRSGQQVVHLLAEASRRRGKAVVIVSHDTRMREVADRVVLMEDGRLRAGA